MRHSPVHKGERVTHVEQRVNYIIINKFMHRAAAANVRAPLFNISHYFPAAPAPLLGYKCCAPPLKLILHSRVHSQSRDLPQRCLLRILMHIAICGVQRESERQIHNNNNNIMLVLRGASARDRTLCPRRSASLYRSQEVLCVQFVCIDATGKSQ
jgi:hypothetical protein